MTITGPMENRSAGLLRGARGATIIEFVLSLLAVLFVLLWIWETVMTVYTYNVLSDAAKEGARYAIVHGSSSACPSGPNSTSPVCSGAGGTCSPAPVIDPCGDTAACPDSSSPYNNVTNVVKCYARTSFHDISDSSRFQVTVTYLDPTSGGTNAVPGRVRVVVNYNLVPYFNLPWTAPHLTAVAEGRIVN